MNRNLAAVLLAAVLLGVSANGKAASKPKCAVAPFASFAPGEVGQANADFAAKAV